MVAWIEEVVGMVTDNTAEKTTLRGVVDHVTFRNNDNGYSVLRVMVEGTSSVTTVVGICPQARVGSHIVMTGNYITHPKFGKQFSIISASETLPSSAEGIERYLGSGLITGIGEKTAKRIVEHLGESTFDIVKLDVERVAKIPGVGRKKAELLHQALSTQTEFEHVLRFLVEHRISANLSAKIYERFKEKTIETVRNDPYILAREIRGIGFQTADMIALNMGLTFDSPLRLKAGLHFALDEATSEGHCYLPPDTMITRARTLLGVDETIDLSEHLDDLLTTGADVISFNNGVFLKRLDQAENFVAQFVTRRVKSNGRGGVDPTVLHDCVSNAETLLGMTLSKEQRLAVESLGRCPILIITGGPGCGKTTIIKAFTILCDRLGLTLALTAPTGRAAQRMASVCQTGASTIHRLLNYNPRTGGFVYGDSPRQEKLPYDVVIVDEASMIDISLARDLFGALKDTCTLVLVGDKDQLPSVGPGRVFADLIACPEIATVHLSKLFRRAEESRINTIAFSINQGSIPDIPSPDGNSNSDAYFLQREQSEEAARTIENLVADQLPKKFSFGLPDIAILTPSNRGPLGTVELNRRLQERLNPLANRKETEVIEMSDYTLRLNDRVCQRSNNYKIDPAGVFNGDTGTIVEICSEDNALVVELWDGRLIRYERSDLNQLSLAYAVTVHRSQGMESPCVVLAIDTSHFTLLERQLLYTGVTRAKKLLVVVGSKRAVVIASKKALNRKRCTMLTKRIELLTETGNRQLDLL